MYRGYVEAGTGGDPLSSGAFGPGLRRDLADLNRQFLDLSLVPGPATDPRFAWTDCVRRALLRTDEATRERVAACPFALFQIVPPDGPDSLPKAAPRVEDGEAGAAKDDTSVACLSFLHAALFVAWRLADAAPLAARLALGLSPAAELLLTEKSLTQLTRMATAPGLIRPRWPAHAGFWTILVAAAEGREGRTMQQAYCVGICLLDAEVSGGGAAAGPRHRGPR
jgi:hypothetical protein